MGLQDDYFVYPQSSPQVLKTCRRVEAEARIDHFFC